MSLPLATGLMLAAAADQSAETIAPGEWAITSTVAELSVPGVPGFIQRMVRGRSKAERKRVAAGQGVEALLAPDPKAHCRVDSQQIGDGRYSQAITCPQKKGEPMHITRIGTYDGSGFAGRATVAGITPKGAMRIVLDQRAARIASR